jgi:hypothetical protein
VLHKKKLFFSFDTEISSLLLIFAFVLQS